MTNTKHTELTINRRKYEVKIVERGGEVNVSIKYVKGGYTEFSTVRTIFVGKTSQVTITDRNLPKTTLEKLTKAVTEEVAEYLAK